MKVKKVYTVTHILRQRYEGSEYDNIAWCLGYVYPKIVWDEKAKAATRFLRFYRGGGAGGPGGGGGGQMKNTRAQNLRQKNNSWRMSGGR